MTTTTTPNELDVVQAIVDAMASVEVPEFTGIYTRTQPKGDRKFNVKGPKADAVRRMLLVGGFKRAFIADFVGCSVSRVAEVAWGLDHDGITYDVAR